MIVEAINPRTIANYCDKSHHAELQSRLRNCLREAKKFKTAANRIRRVLRLCSTVKMWYHNHPINHTGTKRHRFFIHVGAHHHRTSHVYRHSAHKWGVHIQDKKQSSKNFRWPGYGRLIGFFDTYREAQLRAMAWMVRGTLPKTVSK